MKVNFSYLEDKFLGCMDASHPIYKKMVQLLEKGDFTLGEAVGQFERTFAEMCGVKHAIGVANGTDALRISLRAVGVKPGDEVITAANTFVASAGCIDELFAVPRFVDMAPGYVMDASLLERAITKKTKAIIPVWFTGNAPEMKDVMDVANYHNIPVVEDACQAFMAEYAGKMAGSFGRCGAFSLHPLKNLNCWGDGGVITTNDDALAAGIRQYRNHGLRDRDSIDFFGCNSRLDTLQAIVLNFLIKETRHTTAKRRENADYYYNCLKEVPGICFAPRRAHVKQCYHLFMFEVESSIRSRLVGHLTKHGIDAKIHYPIPLQGVLELCGYGPADFPVAYEQASRVVTIPAHDHLTKEQMDYVILRIKEFMLA